MDYGDFKDLNRRTFTSDKTSNISKDPNCDGYQHGLASMVSKCFDKNTSVSGIKNIPNKELAEELHKTIIRKFNKRKVHLPFIDSIWDPDLADIQLISKFNKEFRFLLCVIDIYSKYT